MVHELFIGGLLFSTSSERLRETFMQGGAPWSRPFGNSALLGVPEQAFRPAA